MLQPLPRSISAPCLEIVVVPQQAAASADPLLQASSDIGRHVGCNGLARAAAPLTTPRLPRPDGSAAVAQVQAREATYGDGAFLGGGCGAWLGAFLGSLAASVPLIVVGALELVDASDNDTSIKSGLTKLLLGVLLAPVVGGLTGAALGACCGAGCGACCDSV